MLDQARQSFGGLLRRLARVADMVPRRPDWLLSFDRRGEADCKPGKQLPDTMERSSWRRDEGPVELASDLIEVELDRDSGRGEQIRIRGKEDQPITARIITGESTRRITQDLERSPRNRGNIATPADFEQGIATARGDPGRLILGQIRQLLCQSMTTEQRSQDATCLTDPDAGAG